MNAITKEFTDAIEAQFAKLNKDVQEALVEAKTAQGIVLDLEQRASRPAGRESGDETPGEQFAAHIAEMKDVAQASINGRRANFGIETKSTLTTSLLSAGAVTGQAYRDLTVMLPQRVLRVRGLLPTIQITTGAVEYPKQTNRTNNAAAVPETQAKPESAYSFTMQTATPKVIAHWIPASRQVLDDAPQLKGLIDTELLYGLALKEDQQLLYGDGTGENLPGLVTNSTGYVAPFAPTGGTNMLDQVALAMLQVTLSDFNPTGIVMHPSDWVRMRLLKDAQGKYLLGDPGEQVEPRLFGLPVVPTTSMRVDKFLVGDFPAASTLYDRWLARIEVSTEHADFFVRNMVAILAEERLALAIKQSLALVYGDFGNVPD